MAHKPVIVLPEHLRALIAPKVPDGVDLRGFANLEEALALAPEAEIGWFDDFVNGIFFKAPPAAVNAKWLNTMGAGLDVFPIQLFAQRGQVFTNGVGLTPDLIADFTVMGVLSLAKRLDEIVRAHDRQEWLRKPPGTFEMLGSKALIIGYGAIGSEIGKRLRVFGVDVTGVRRSADADPAVIGPNDWRPRLAEFDWIILAAPDTSATRAMIGPDELAAAKPGAFIVNIARGSLIDQPALIAALESGQIGAAFLDPTTPEPLPADDPLWKAPNTIITMHKSGASQTTGARRGVERFLANLERYLKGEPLEHVVDFARGY